MESLYLHLKNLISFKTYEGNPNKKEEVQKLYDYVVASIPKGYKHKLFESNGHKSLVIYSKSLNYPDIVYQAHVDVVPADDSMFTMQEKDGILYGRGVFDMKFAVATYIELLNKFDPEEVNIGVWLTSDEEIGGFDGVRFLLNECFLKTKVCFLPDGGTGNALITNAKGMIRFKITASGVSSHGSRPWIGDNAIEKLIKAFGEIKTNDLFSFTDEETHWNNTINLGKISGGMAGNVVPNHAEMEIDIRLISNDCLDKSRELIKNICEKYDLTSEETLNGKAYSLDMENKYVKSFIKSLEDQNYFYTLARDHGSSDARFFVEKDIPVIMFMPGGGKAHTEEEWCEKERLERYGSVLEWTSDL